MKQEIEVKLRLAGGAAEARRQIESCGGRCTRERVFEENVLYDGGSMRLAREGRLLRLRRLLPAGAGAPSARLTLKEPPVHDQGRYKVRGEIETDVADPDALEQILGRLALEPVWRYQKYRTAFTAETPGGRAEVLLDETPIGNFIEIEGAPGAIDAFAQRLGYSTSDYITLSYRALQEQAWAGSGREPGDLVFETE